MKSFGILVKLFFLLSLTHAQVFWDWSEPVALTDSISNNTNPYFQLLYASNGEVYMNMVFEKSSDTGSTAIFYRNVLNNDEAVEVVGAAGMHFRNPRILNIDLQDTLFYVFYEAGPDGSRDICYSKFSSDGIFTGPFPLAVTDANETNLAIGDESMMKGREATMYTLHTLAWTRDGALVTCDMTRQGNIHSFTEPVIIDTLSCSDIYLAHEWQIYWIREEAGHSWIYYSTRSYQGNWNAPAVYFDEHNSANLSGDKVAGQYLTWSSLVDGTWKMFIGNTYFPPSIYPVEPELNEPFTPAICTYVIGVAHPGQEIGDLYLAFPFPDNGNNEIFMNEYPYNPWFYNFSNSGTASRNPDFYFGESPPLPYWCFYVYLVWESYRNDHWQIFASKTEMCVGSVDENEEDKVLTKLFPNPFNDRVTIEYVLERNTQCSLVVYDHLCKRVRELFKGSQSPGVHQLVWDSRNDSGAPVAPGLYLVQLSINGKTFTSKLMKAE